MCVCMCMGSFNALHVGGVYDTQVVRGNCLKARIRFETSKSAAKKKIKMKENKKLKKINKIQ